MHPNQSSHSARRWSGLPKWTWWTRTWESSRRWRWFTRSRRTNEVSRSFRWIPPVWSRSPPLTRWPRRGAGYSSSWGSHPPSGGQCGAHAHNGAVQHVRPGGQDSGHQPENPGEHPGFQGEVGEQPARPQVEGAVERIWAFGPRRCGPNILLNSVEGYRRPSVWQCLERETEIRDFDNSIASGFQFGHAFWSHVWGTFDGGLLLCRDLGHEAFCSSSSARLSRWGFPSCRANNDDQSESFAAHQTNASSASSNRSRSRAEAAGSSVDCYGPFSGQLIAAMKEACRYAFQAKPQRLMAAMYTCEIMATAEVLGKQFIQSLQKHIKHKQKHSRVSIFTKSDTMSVQGFVSHKHCKTKKIMEPHYKKILFKYYYSFCIFFY